MQFKRKFLAIIAIFMFLMMCTVSSFAADTVTTLTDLEAAIATGESIKLMADIEGSIVIPLASEIELDLNGYELSSSTGNTVVNNGTLTINGTGKISASGSGYTALINNTDGTATIDGGAELYATASQAIKNYGSMTIKDATVSIASTATTPVVSNGWYDPNNYATADYGNEPAEDTAVLTINGGTFTSTGDNTYTIKNDRYGILVVNDGSVSSAAHTNGRQYNVVWNWNEITINGGTFIQNDTKMNSILGNGFTDAENGKGILNIKGGTFNHIKSQYLFWDYTVSGETIEDTGTITIDDGTFNASVGANHQKPLTINGGTFAKGVGYYNDEEIIINGGTFNQPVGLYIKSPMTINGGTFNDYIGYNDAPMEINGGTFGDIYGAKDVVTINSGDFAGYNGELYSGLTENGAVVVNGGNFAMAVPEEVLGENINFEANSNAGDYPYSYHETLQDAQEAAGTDGTVRELNVCIHNLTKVNEVPATCTEAGTAAYWTCSLCNLLFADGSGDEEIQEPAVIQALGHNYGEWTVVTEATFNEAGLRRRTCTRCDAYEEEAIPSLADSTWRVDTIYTAGGVNEGNRIYFENLTLNFSPADYSIGRVLDGYWVGVRFLAPVDVTPDTIDNVLYNNGSKDASGDLIWKSFKNAKDGQTAEGRYYMQAWVPLTEVSTAACCANEDTMKWTYKFSTTGNTEVTDDILIEVNPENIELKKNGERVVKYENYVQIHTVTYVYEESGEVISTEEVAHGGNVANIPEVEVPEGMCGYDFDYDYIDDEIPLEEVEIEEDMEIRVYFYDHIITPVAEVPATCTEDGTAAHYKCSYCDKLFSDSECENEIQAPAVINKLGHNYGEWVVDKEATPFEEGHKQRECSRCHDIQEENIPKTENTLFKGDLDKNSIINIIDVRLLLQAVINSEPDSDWTEEENYIMNMNNDDYINIIDVRLLLQNVINNS